MSEDEFHDIAGKIYKIIKSKATGLEVTYSSNPPIKEIEIMVGTMTLSLIKTPAGLIWEIETFGEETRHQFPFGNAWCAATMLLKMACQHVFDEAIRTLPEDIMKVAS